MLLLTALTIKDALRTRFDGVLGDLECSIWNGEMFLWGGLVASTWNLVCLTLERSVCWLGLDIGKGRDMANILFDQLPSKLQKKRKNEGEREDKQNNQQASRTFLH